MRVRKIFLHESLDRSAHENSVAITLANDYFSFCLYSVIRFCFDYIGGIALARHIGV